MAVKKADTVETSETGAPLVVTAAVVAAKRVDGTLVYLYRGTPLPGGLDNEQVARLTALGMVGESAVPVVGADRTLTGRAVVVDETSTGR